MLKYAKSLFIFRRDLRLDDNTGLLAACRDSGTVIPCFICDPRQLVDNPYRSDNAVQFMSESLEDLREDIRGRGGELFILSGKADEVVERVLDQIGINAVYVNQDYTPFSQHRDEAIRAVCQHRGVEFFDSHDTLLNEPSEVSKNDGGVYTIYTPYMKKARQIPVRSVSVNRFRNFDSGPMAGSLPEFPVGLCSARKGSAFAPGGRQAAVKILDQLAAFKDYVQQRDVPSIKGTTGLSAHLKFGTISAREVYHAVRNVLGEEHVLINQLYWRDFFTQIGFHYPKVLGEAFQDKYGQIRWSTDPRDFAAWCEGRTGFPIVDAGMRELNATGFMHNRARMITASFLVKDLHLDWRMGEKYFARKLVDYDPLVNNGNWQWAASTGCDAQPYFRIFNPWRQQERFDPQAIYIKKWIPELRDAPFAAIHALEKTPLVENVAYPRPMVDHRAAAEKAKALFQRR